MNKLWSSFIIFVIILYEGYILKSKNRGLQTSDYLDLTDNVPFSGTQDLR